MSFDALGNRVLKIPKTEYRGIKLQQLDVILGFIKELAHVWVETCLDSRVHGSGLGVA